MTSDAVRLRVEGPLVDAQLSDPGGPLGPERVRLIIDTGADMTVMSRRIIDRPGMVRTRVDGVLGATGAAVRAPVYRVHLAIDMLGTTFDLDVVALVRDEGECDGLLGRDVLAHLRFVYDGPAGVFTLATPSEQEGLGQ